MTKLKIKVTKEILEKSKNCGGELSNCAVALAVRDIFPRATVTGPYMRPFGQSPDNREYMKWIALPAEVNQFVGKFDYNTPEDRMLMDELEFEIEIPEEVIECINIDEIKQLLVNHPTLELV